jgi:hypothetical protein
VARLAAFLPVDERASAAAEDMGAADVDEEFSSVSWAENQSFILKNS